MEQKEWHRLAIQSVSVFLAAFLCCFCYAGRIQENLAYAAKAEENVQKGYMSGKAEEEQKDLLSEKEQEQKKENSIQGTVVIDAGHGGSDEGTFSRNKKHIEKDYNLLIAMQVRKILQEKGIKVYCTRTDDIGLKKKQRVKLANRKDADFLISIHCNASDWGDTQSNGIETLYSARTADGARLANKKLAEIMLEELVAKTGLRRRKVIRREGLYLLHYAKIPATIVEIGYISNKKDLKFIASKSGQQKIAQGICNGIVRALEEK